MAEKLAIDRSKTAVIIMDYQMRQLSFFTEAFQQEILARAKEVLTKARGAGIPVINIEVVRGERTPETKIHPSVAPPPGEMLLTKTTAGPFASTNLEQVLKQKGFSTLALLGLTTSGCVLSTVRYASDLGYRLVVLSDCCADRDEEVQRVLMEKIFPRQFPQPVAVVPAQEFIQALG